MVQLRVCLAGTETSLAVSVPQTATVADLRAAIFAAAAADQLHPAKHRLRLIAAGKLLHPSATLAAASVRDGDVVHCAVSDLDHARAPDAKPAHAESSPLPPTTTTTTTTTPTTTATTTTTQGARSILVTEGPAGETRILVSAATQTIATLRAAGLSDEQIIAVRFSFLLERDADDPAEPLRFDLDELEANEWLALAAQHGSGPAESAHVEDGAFVDYLWGFMLGALLGLIMLILSLDRSIALSRRWKRGIAMGALLNVVFGVVLLVNDGLPR